MVNAIHLVFRAVIQRMCVALINTAGTLRRGSSSIKHTTIEKCFNDSTKNLRDFPWVSITSGLVSSLSVRVVRRYFRFLNISLQLRVDQISVILTTSGFLTVQNCNAGSREKEKTSDWNLQFFLSEEREEHIKRRFDVEWRADLIWKRKIVRLNSDT